MGGFPGGTGGKELARQCRRRKRQRFNPCIGKIPWRRAWQPTPVFLPGESHGQRNLAGYNPWGRKESDTTEWLTHTARAHTHTGVAFVVVVIICIYPAWCLFSELPGSVVWCLILILILLLVFNNLGKFSVIIVSNMSSVPFSFRYSHYVYIIPL